MCREGHKDLLASTFGQNKKENKRKQKGDKADTMTNKKGDKTGDKGRQKGDKEMLHGQRKRASSDRKGGHILKKNLEPLTVNCLGKKGSTIMSSL